MTTNSCQLLYYLFIFFGLCYCFIRSIHVAFMYSNFVILSTCLRRYACNLHHPMTTRKHGSKWTDSHVESVALRARYITYSPTLGPSVEIIKNCGNISSRNRILAVSKREMITLITYLESITRFISSALSSLFFLWFTSLCTRGLIIFTFFHCHN